MKEYYVSNEQLAEALKIATGIATGPGESVEGIRSIANGVIILVGTAPSVNSAAATQEPAAVRKVNSEGRVRLELPPGGGGSTTEPEVDPTLLQEALRPHMARVPGLRTLKAYSPEQRKQALKWARAKAKGKDVQRPSFIQEPAPRGGATIEQAVELIAPKAESEKPKTEGRPSAPEPDTANGAVPPIVPSGSVSDFYDN